MDEVKLTIEIENPDMLAELFGQRDENVRVIEDETGVRISMQEGSICISGQQEQAEVAQTVVRRLMLLLARRERIDKTRIRYAIELAAEGRDELIDEIMSDVVAITYRGKQIRAKTLGQSRYVNAMKNNTVVFGVGPAGTGKTYLAMAAAVMAFKNKEVSRHSAYPSCRGGRGEAGVSSGRSSA